MTTDPDGAQDGSQTGEEPIGRPPSLRWPWWLGLAVVLAVGGALAGWYLTVPEYRSEGLVFIAASVPTPRDPEGRHVMPGLDEFIESQRTVMESRRVIERARQSSEWASVGRAMETAEFEERLRVEHRRRSLHLRPNFTDPDPEVAGAAIRAVVRAYLEVARDVNSESDAETLNVLEARRSALGNELALLDRNILELVTRYGGPEALQLRLELLVTESVKLESERREVDDEIGRLRSDARPPEGGARGDSETSGDGSLASLLRRREGLARRLVRLESEIARLGRDRARVEILHAKRESLRRKLADTEDAYEQVRALASSKARIRILDEGDVPEVPHRDPRWRWAVGLGAVGPVLVLVLTLLGGLRRRHTVP